jgi:hypothetical protein
LLEGNSKWDRNFRAGRVEKFSLFAMHGDQVVTRRAFWLGSLVLFADRMFGQKARSAFDQSAPDEGEKKKAQVGFIIIEPVPGTEKDEKPQFGLKVVRSNLAEYQRMSDDSGGLVTIKGCNPIKIPPYPYSMRVDSIDIHGSKASDLNPRVESAVVKWFGAEDGKIVGAVIDFLSEKRADKAGKNKDDRAMIELPSKFQPDAMWAGVRDRLEMELKEKRAALAGANRGTLPSVIAPSTVQPATTARGKQPFF